MRNLGSGRLSSLPRSHGYTWQYWDYNQNLTQSAGPGPLCYPGSPAPLLLAVEQGYREGGGWKEAGPGTPHLSAMLPPRVSQGYLLDLLGSRGPESVHPAFLSLQLNSADDCSAHTLSRFFNLIMLFNVSSQPACDMGIVTPVSKMRNKTQFFQFYGSPTLARARRP